MRLLPSLTGLLCVLIAACGVIGRPLPHRILAVGDLHGDIVQALGILKHSHVICYDADYYEKKLRAAAMKWIVEGKQNDDASELLDRERINRNMIYNKRGEYMAGSRADSYHWCGKNTTLILLGDSLNVGPDDFDIVYFMMRLTQEAREGGGRLVYLLGNHELQNLQGNFMGVHPWSFERSGGREGRAILLSMKTALGRFLRSRPVFHREGSLLFMHGGITSKSVLALKDRLPTFDNTTFVDDVNRRVRRAMEEMATNTDGVPTEPAKDPVARFILDYDYESKTGDRSPILVHPLDQCEEVAKANAELGIGAQVVGHTPHDPPQFAFCDGRLLALDFHLSAWKANGSSYAALQLLRVASAEQQLTAPSVNDWSATLIIPRPDELQPKSKPQSTSPFNAGTIGVALLGVAAVEAVLWYSRRRLQRPE